MAQAQMLNLAGNLPPEILQQQQALTRQQQLANLLTQQGMNQPQGQMVSGRFVAPSFFQYAAPLAQLYAGQKMAEKGDKAQADLAKALRQQYANEAQQYQDLLRGKEAVFEQAGPTQSGGNIPNQTYRAGADPQAAYLFGSTAYNPALQQVALKKLTEGPQWKEITQFNQQTGNTENYRYDANSTNPRETMQFLGISKPAISPEAQIRFGDEGIGIPPQFRGGQPVAQPTSPYGANVQFTPNLPIARPQGQPMGQPQVATTVAPTVGVAAPTVDSAQGYDYFKNPPVPAGLSGKQAREFVSEQNKPLTGKPADQVTGAINYQKSLDKVQSLLDTYKGPQLLDPNVRAEIKGAIKTAQLQGKEAFGLGVLNGPDLGILEEIIADPTAFDAFLKDRSTINKLYNNQRMFTADAIKTNYRFAQKAVPENLREYVEIKPKELTKPETKAGQPKATGRVVRAMMGSEPIVVRDGKWVYERTGKVVQ
jgi:hypothetical protein